METYVRVQVPIGTAHTGGSYYFAPTPEFYPQVEIMDGVVAIQPDGTFLLPIANPFETIVRFSRGDPVGVVEPTATISFKEWHHGLYNGKDGYGRPPAGLSSGIFGATEDSGESTSAQPTTSAPPAKERTPPPSKHFQIQGRRITAAFEKIKEHALHRGRRYSRRREKITANRSKIS
ncbi:MAG: hypothetical protein GY820_10975 [Gammaproteobacteria bacterium]|nr:hypothetical protein [Gammaproteobacteria bacterium]